MIVLESNNPEESKIGWFAYAGRRTVLRSQKSSKFSKLETRLRTPHNMEISKENKIFLWPPKDGIIALWSASNRWYVVKCVSQNRNQSNNKNQWYNILVTFIFKLNFGQYETKIWLLSNLVDSLPGWLIRVRLFHPWVVKVWLGFSRTNADSQWNPVYNVFHRKFCCGNETIRR